MPTDIIGQALVDFYNGSADTLWINNKYGDPEEMPLEVFFRDAGQLTNLEKTALECCKGRVLDVGAGAGAVSLILQDELEVTAIESSEGACQVMRAMGVRNGIIGDVFDYKEGKFDTLLFLMNGIGIVGSLDSLTTSLQYFKSLLVKDGRLLLDSSDISYLYDEIPYSKDQYYGELKYQYEYKKQKGEWFNWLYVDFRTLQDHATEAGLKTELLFEDENDQYLACLTNI